MKSAVLSAACVLASVITAQAGTLELLTRSATGDLADGTSFNATFTKGSRELMCESRATNLAPNDTDVGEDVLVLNLKKHTFECVSVTDDELPIAAPCYFSGVSTNGRYVAFLSNGTGIAPGVPGGDLVAYVRDRKQKTTRGIAFTSTGVPITDYLYRTRISPCGRYATFASDLANVVPGIAGGKYQTYLRDLKLGTTELISMDVFGGGANDDVVIARITSGGRYVFFTTIASDIVFNDTNGNYDLFVRDRKLQTTTRVSVDANGGQLPSGMDEFDVTPNGRFVTFSSNSDVLANGLSNNGVAYWLDRKPGALKQVAIPQTIALPAGTQPNGLSISANGRRVALLTSAELTDDDLGTTIADLYLCTPKTGAIQLVTKDALGGPISDDAWWPTIASNGKRAAFSSQAADIVGVGASNVWHLFLYKP